MTLDMRTRQRVLSTLDDLTDAELFDLLDADTQAERPGGCVKLSSLSHRSGAMEFSDDEALLAAACREQAAITAPLRSALRRMSISLAQRIELKKMEMRKADASLRRDEENLSAVMGMIRHG